MSVRSLAQRVRRRLAGNAAPAPGPRLSVVVPMYEVEDYLAACLDSVLGQSLKNLEVVVVDDGSTDGSLDIARQYADADPRVRIVRRPNGGLGAARNTGLEHVLGDYVTFVDSDDLIPAGSYRAMVGSLDRSGSDLVVGQIMRLRRGSLDPMGWAQQLHARRRTAVPVTDFPEVLRDFYTPNKVYRTSFWRAHGFRFREVGIFEDQPTITQIYASAHTVDVLPDVTYWWRVRGDGSSLSQSMHGIAEIRARQEAVELTRDVLEQRGSAALTRAWKWTLIDAHFPHYLGHTAGEALDAVRDMARAVLTVEDVLACRETPADLRVLNYLALTGTSEEVSRFVLETRDRRRDLPVRWRDGTGYVELPVAALGGVELPDELLQLTSSQCVARAWLREFRWADDVLELAGRAYVEYVDPALFEQRVSVVAEHLDSGTEVVLPTRPDPRPWTGTPTTHAWIEYDDTTFVARVPLAALAEALGQRLDLAEWHIDVRVNIRGLARDGSFAEVAAGSLRELGGVADSAESSAVARWSADDGLKVTVLRAPVRVIDLRREDDRLLLDVAVTPGRSVIAAELVPVGGGPAAPLRVCGAPTEPVTISAAVTDLAQHVGDWRVVVVLDDGVRKSPLVSDAVRERASRRGVVASQSRRGQLLLAGRQRMVLVTAASLTAEGISLEADCFGIEPGGVALRLRTARVSTPQTAVRPVGGRRIEAVVPFEYEEWGHIRRGVLPRGNYVLTAGDARVQVLGVATQVLQPPPLRATLVPSLRSGIGVHVRRPLTDDERGRWNQRELVARWTHTEEPVRPTALFQSLRGDAVSGSLLAVSHELHRQRPDIGQVWATEDHTVDVPAHAARVIVDSEACHHAYATSRWVLVDHELSDTFQKRPGQVVVQTYHGHPYKMMGLSRWRQARTGETEIARRLASAAQWDHLLAPSPLAERLYRENFPVELNYLTVGHPRDDMLVDPAAEEVRARTRELLGIDPAAVAVLYAPTWRDYNASDPWRSKLVDFLDPTDFAETMGAGYPLLLRGHPAHQRHPHRAAAAGGVIDVTDYPEINDLILASDVGVFDYSSIRFDYSVTGKPMLFFVPDEDIYLRTVGTLLDYADSTPGPRSRTLEELARDLRDLDDVRTKYAPAYADFVRTFNPFDDGHASARVVEAVFGDPPPQEP